MKYRITVLLSLLILCFILVGSMHTLRAGDTRGDRQFTFTTHDHGGTAGLPTDGPTAKYKDEARRSERAERDAREAPSTSSGDMPPAPSGQQAGQASSDETRGREARTRLGEDAQDPILRQQGVDELRHGQSAGQTSNVPGTTTTSPNPTGNLFGTKGIPIFREDRIK